MKTRRTHMSTFVTIIDGFARNFDDRRIGQIIKATQQGKIPWIVLRDYGVPSAEFREAAVMMVRNIRLSNRDAQITINRRVDLAYELGTGVHLGNDFDEIESARRKLGRAARIGVSLHHREEIDRRVFQFVDYAFYSPIFRTSSKPNSRPINKEGLQRFCARHPELKIYALGGITPDKVHVCFEAGAHGVAVASGITKARNVMTAAQDYSRAIVSANRKRRMEKERGNREQ